MNFLKFLASFLVSVLALTLIFMNPIPLLLFHQFIPRKIIDADSTEGWINKALEKRGKDPIKFKVAKFLYTFTLKDIVIITGDLVITNFEPTEEDLKYIALGKLSLADSLDECEKNELVHRSIYTKRSVDEIRVNGLTRYTYKTPLGEITTKTLLPFIQPHAVRNTSFKELNLHQRDFIDKVELYENLRKNPDEVFNHTTKGKLICTGIESRYQFIDMNRINGWQ